MYARLAGLYLFYFAALGAMIPYIGLYLAGAGYSAREIGILMALQVSARIVAPNLLAWYADHIGRRMRIVRVAALMTCICFVGMWGGTGFAWLVLVLASWAFFFSAMMPQFEATALNHLGAQRYGGIRLWGSIGFIASVAGVGPLLDKQGAEALLPVTLALLAGAFVFSLLVPERDHPDAQAPGQGLLSVLRRPEVLGLFAIGLFAQFAHGPYYAFFSLYLEGLGYTRTVIGQMWALGVVAEIVVFVLMGRLLARFRPVHLLAWSLGLSVVRWLLIAAFADKIAALALAQTLHLASFGIFHAVSIGLVHRYFPGRLQGRGQALFSSLTFGVGTALGSLAAGYLWDGISPPAVFIASALSAALAFVLLVYRKA
ncbi:MAG: MFS transporter [Xanthomonadaceae bacterium]|nr:MFS transporter [Xanthomonadaceae bacterium]